MTQSKQLSIDMGDQVEILFKESYSQKQIAKKLKFSRPRVQYLLQRQLETSTNVDRKRVGTPKVITAAKNKNLINKSKIHRRKTAPELKAKPNFS